MLQTEVLRVTVPRDQETGKDRGIAFVKVLDATMAADVADCLDGYEFEGRVLNSNVKERRGKPKWVPRDQPDPASLDDGGLFERLASDAPLDAELEDKFAIQELGLEMARNARVSPRLFFWDASTSGRATARVEASFHGRSAS